MGSFLLILLIIIVLYIFVKTTGFQYSRTWTFVIGLLLLFFLVTFAYVVKNYGGDVSSFTGVSSALKTYFAWLGSFFKNIKSITGNVINADWGGNVTNFTK